MTIGLTMKGITFRDYLPILAVVLASAFICIGIGSATEQLVMSSKSNENGASNQFSKIYVDGFNANSNGYKLLLRTYERRMDTYFQPLLVDIDFVLMEENITIYQDTIKQVALLSEGQGTTEITNQAHIALKEGRNYTSQANIYLNEEGIPIYYVTAISSFKAKNDAIITEVYGDSIGASATIKSKSMVPLNATIVFTLTHDGKTLEKKEIIAPPIMSHDKEKTVNVLWSRNLDDGIYMVSSALQGNDLIVNYDKVFTVEKRVVANSAKPVETSNKNLPGFTSSLTVIIIISLFIQRGSKHGS